MRGPNTLYIISYQVLIILSDSVRVATQENDLQLRQGS